MGITVWALDSQLCRVKEEKRRVRKKMRGQILVAATTIVRRVGFSSLARINTPLDGRFLTNQRGIVTSIARLGDDKADTTNLAQKVDPKDAAAKKAAEEATKKAVG